MPASYTHYRFGAQAAALFPPEAQRSIRQFRRLYNAGLQGPDIFFYHNVFFRDKTVALASQFHETTGEEFFARCRIQLANSPSEAAMVYLWGLLTHYCLDSVMHPFVLEQIAEGSVTHRELETEFDRYLLQQDGIRQPATYNRASHVKLTDGECATAALFYPPATPGAVRGSIGSMVFFGKILSLPSGTLRQVVEWGAGEKLRQHFIQRTPNRSCAHLNEGMLEHYNRALEALPEMIRCLQAHLDREEPLGPLFENTFNG